MARREVRFQPSGGDEDRPASARSVPRWWRGPDPDPTVVGRLYAQDGRTETEIAVLLSISRARVAAVLRDAGLVALGGVAAYVGLRRRTAGRHARANMPAAQALSVPALQGGALQGGMAPAVQPA